MDHVGVIPTSMFWFPSDGCGIQVEVVAVRALICSSAVAV